MKKLILLAAAIACTASMAFAEEAAYTPSITVEGMYGSQIEFVEESVADEVKESAFLLPVVQTVAIVGADAAQTPVTPGMDEVDVANVAENYRQLYETRNEELAAVKESESVAAYFGEAVNFEEKLGTAEYHMDELIPIIAGGFTSETGAVKARLVFSTPYEKDQKVVVMIGIITGVDENGNRIIEWIPYDGLGMGEVVGAPELSGAVEITLDNETLLKIQNNEALLAVVSA